MLQWHVDSWGVGTFERVNDGLLEQAAVDDDDDGDENLRLSHPGFSTDKLRNKQTVQRCFMNPTDREQWLQQRRLPASSYQG